MGVVCSCVEQQENFEVVDSIPKKGLKGARNTQLKPIDVAAQFASLFSVDNEDMLREQFAKVDTNGDNSLDRHEIGAALRGSGKSELEVQVFLDCMWQEELDFEGFKDLVQPKWRMVSVFSALAGTGDPNASDSELKKVFDIIDEDGSGTLDHEEIRHGLLRMGKMSVDVERMIAQLKLPEYTFDAFKDMVHSMPAAPDVPVARKRVDQALLSRKKIHDSGQLICFTGGGIPPTFETHLYDAEKDLGIPDFDAVKFMLFRKDAIWRLQSIVQEGTVAKHRLNLPKAWRGLKANKLTEASGIEGAIRVSLNGIVADHATYEGAVAMFGKALTLLQLTQ